LVSPCRSLLPYLLLKTAQQL